MADLSNQEIYTSLETEVKANALKKRNCLIITIPGLGISHELRSIADSNKESGISHIFDKESELSGFNILDLNFDTNQQAISQVDYYFKKATSDQKFAVVINTPYALDSSDFMGSYFSSRVYARYYYRVFNERESELFARDLEAQISAEEIRKLYELSGGIGRILKFLILNTDNSTTDLETLVRDVDFESVLKSVVTVVEKCKEEDLEKIGIWNEGKYVSKIVEEYFKIFPVRKSFNIKVEEDLTFSEENEKYSETLTKTEGQILEEIALRSVITREKISEFKWGEGSYDVYSDQAINKTMQRLGKKLKKHTITPIPKVGYKLTKTNG